MDKCPVCGYDERRATSRQHNIMNTYVNEKNSSDTCVVNSTEARLVMGDKVYIKASSNSGNIKESTTPVLPMKPQEAPKQTEQVPVVSAAPTVPSPVKK